MENTASKECQGIVLGQFLRDFGLKWLALLVCSATVAAGMGIIQTDNPSHIRALRVVQVLGWPLLLTFPLLLAAITLRWVRSSYQDAQPALLLVGELHQRTDRQVFEACENVVVFGITFWHVHVLLLMVVFGLGGPAARVLWHQWLISTWLIHGTVGWVWLSYRLRVHSRWACITLIYSCSALLLFFSSVVVVANAAKGWSHLMNPGWIILMALVAMIGEGSRVVSQWQWARLAGRDAAAAEART